MDGCRPEADNVFGPVVTSCRDRFDFTLLFEQAILSMAPSALVLAASVYRLRVLYRQPSKTISAASVPWLTAKQAAIVGFAITQLILTILWAVPGSNPTQLSIAASALSFASSIVLAGLSYVEHDRSVHPSAILTTYLLFSILFDVCQTRTLWLRRTDTAIAIVFSIGTAMKTGMLGIEMVGKRSMLQSPYRDWSPETLGGIINQSVFWWLNDLLRKGSATVLQLTDLYPLDPCLESARLQSSLKAAWEDSAQQKSYALLLATFICFWKPMVAVAIPRIALIAFKFCQPLLIDRAVSLLSVPNGPRETDIGRALIGATALVYAGVAVCTAQYKHKTYRYITMMRGGLISLIYDTTLQLDTHAANEAAAVTLMSTDIDRIVAGFEWADALWAGPLEIAVAIYMLYTQIGLSCLGPVIIAILFVLTMFAFGKLSVKYQRDWIEAVQRRVTATSSVLDNMKGIKMSGLSHVFNAELQQLRVLELIVSSKFRQIIALFAVLSNFSGATIPILTLIIYVLVTRATTGVELNPSVAFTSISLVTLLAAPIQQFATALIHFAAATGCFQRIQEYLLKTAQREDHVFRPPSTTETLNGVELQTMNPFARQFLQTGSLLCLQGTTFAFTPRGTPVLHDISLDLPVGVRTVVVGPTGSGKTALLLALLDELYTTKGFVYSRSSLKIGYCAQETWLPNLDIRSIILGGSDYDEGWYLAVLGACALHQDLQDLPKGDKSIIGSKGTSLSGGQKQRISLARALYARTQLLLLDDVLSGLDANTEQAVLDNVFGPHGICHKTGTAVVFATHSARHVKQADHVIIMEPGGTILKQGTPSSVNLVSADGGESDCEITDDDATNHRGALTPPRPEIGEQMEEEPEGVQLLRKTGDIRLYSYYFRMLGWEVTTVMAVSCALFAFSAKFPTVWLNWWSDAETKHPGQQTTMYMTIYGVFCVICLVVLIVGIYVLAMAGIPRSSNKLHAILLQRVMAAPYWFFVSTDSGQTLNRFSQDMSLIDMQLPIALVDFSFGVFLCIMEAILIALVSKWAALMYPPLIGILFILQKFYLRTSRQMRFLDLELKSPLYSHFLETLQGLTTIRAFGWQASAEMQNHRLLDNSQRPFYLMFSIQRWLGFVLDAMVTVIATVIMALATQVRGSSAGGLGVSLTNILSFSSTLSLLIRAWTELETSLGAVSRVRSFEKDTPSEHLLHEHRQPPPDWPSNGELIVSDLSSHYRPGSKDVLRDVSLKIQPGEKLGICGRTGSGKTSFILAILRLTEITKGEIFLDGLPLSSIPRLLVRQSITAIPQEPLILRGTVRFNADPFSRHSDIRIVWALREVGIWDVIIARGGLDAEMDSVALSRGEQQLFCLTRALLAKPRILILDEVTSSVDSAREEHVMEVLRRNFAETTVLMIVHHLQIVRQFDRILVLNQGKVVEWGEPEQLMAQDSAFRSLLESQQGTTANRHSRTSDARGTLAYTC
ncbi:P-loop containing nucleoside triphosphate hydrolase protein [Aspergillus tetrazonus]